MVTMKKGNRKIAGLILAALGLLILLTPFTPGSILLLIGLDMAFGHRWMWWKNKKKKFLKFLRK
ncbi:MAG: hypothetical protein AAB585_00445 [Patescibacteria group bacterium]